MKTRVLLAAAACLVALTAGAADWPQFRGPNRDGASKETGLLKKWPKDGPKLLWTYKDAGAGYSSPAVVGDRLYLSGARGDDEYLFALDLKKGPPAEVWKVKIGPKFVWNNQWTGGPSPAPTVAGDLVFALGSNGDLLCADVKDGKEKWRKNLPKDLGGEVNDVGGGYGSQADDKMKLGWGYAASPLVDGDNVVCVPGGPKGTFAALKKANGDVAWRSDDLKEQATYSSPVISEAGETKQYVVMLQDGAAAVDTGGKLLWRYKRANPYKDIVAATPLVKGDFVFLSAAGSDGGCDLIEVKKDGDKLKAEKVYASKELANFHGGMVLVGDHVYGASGDFGRAKWVCLGLKTGTVAWDASPPRLGKGSLIYADGYLYVLAENGTVVHAEASPDADKKLSAKADSFKLPEESELRKSSGKVWTHPVIANGKLYLRDQDLLFCYDLK